VRAMSLPASARQKEALLAWLNSLQLAEHVDAVRDLCDGAVLSHVLSEMWVCHEPDLLCRRRLASLCPVTARNRWLTPFSTQRPQGL
jgi:hypothetical protein